MKPIKLGIIREGKIPRDKRVPFTPEQCQQLRELFPHVTIVVQPSDWRCYTNAEYEAAGIA